LQDVAVSESAIPAIKIDFESFIVLPPLIFLAHPRYEVNLNVFSGYYQFFISIASHAFHE